MGRRVSQGGVPDGDGSFLISDCSEPEGPQGKVWIRKFDPAVAFDGVNYLVTWVDFYGDFAGYYRTSAARVTPAKTVLDDGIGLSSGGRTRTRGSPSLAFGGLDVPRRLERARGVRGARVTPEGSVLDPSGFTMSLSGARSPVDAFDGTNYLGVWDDGVDVSGRA